VVKNSGSAGNYITFSSYPGERATIDVNGVNMTSEIEGGFTISEISYVQVERITKGWWLRIAARQEITLRFRPTLANGQPLM